MNPVPVTPPKKIQLYSVLLFLALLGAIANAAAERYDVILREGTVYDGTGNPRRVKKLSPTIKAIVDKPS